MTTDIRRENRGQPVAGVVTRGLTKTFRSPAGPVVAVRGLDLTIPAGQTVALLGPNGAGKSTTIDMILGLLPPDSGSVEVFGQSPVDAVAGGRVGAMLQTGGVVSDLSVRELIEMTASLYPRPMDVAEVIRMTRIEDLVDRRTTKLSGGQTQRLRFALGLVGDPDLLVLDEPTAALEVDVRRAFWATMREFAGRGKTVLFATHHLEEADAYADRVILLRAGEVRVDGTAGEIKAMVGTRTIRCTLPDVPPTRWGGCPA